MTLSPAGERDDVGREAHTLHRPRCRLRGGVYGRVPWNDHRKRSSASSSATSTRTTRSRWRYATRCIGSAAAGSSASSPASTSRPAPTGTGRSSRSSRRAICSCCSSRRRRRTGTGASTRPGCSRASTSRTSPPSCASSIRRPARRVRSPTCRVSPRNRWPSSGSSASCCRETWCISDDWRRGALAADVRGRARRFRGRGDRGRVPEGNVRGAFALRVSPCRARPPGSRRDRFDHPGVGARRRRRRRDIGVHALAVQPRRRAAHAHLARPARRGRRRRRGLAPSARSTVRRRAQRRAVHADLGDAARVEPRPPPSAHLQTRALSHRPRAGGRRARRARPPDRS